MERRKTAVTTLVIWAGWSMGAAAQTGSAPPDSPGCVVPETPRSVLGRKERTYWLQIDAEIGKLRDDLYSPSDDQRETPDPDPRVGEVRRIADCLGRNYAALSGEQQSAVNVGSQVVTVGAGGSLLSGSSAVWESALGYAAFTPILINQLSALEPKRDLFAGARIGIDRITERHMAIQDAGTAINATTDQGDKLTTACGRVGKVFREAPTTIPEAQRAMIVSETQRLQSQCARLHRVNAGLELTRADYKLIEPSLHQYYATEILSLHDNLTQRHRELLYTPSETFSAILASPFRAADQLISGDGGQKALEQIKTQQAFEGLNLSLTPLAHRVSRPDTDAGSREGLQDGVRTMQGLTEVNTAVAELDLAQTELETVRVEQERDLRRTRQLFDALERTELRFNYSATAKTVTITIDKPTPPSVSP